MVSGLAQGLTKLVAFGLLPTLCLTRTGPSREHKECSYSATPGACRQRSAKISAALCRHRRCQEARILGCEGFIRHRLPGPQPRIHLDFPSLGVDSTSILHWFDMDFLIWPYFDAKWTPEEGRVRRISRVRSGGLCLINPSQFQEPARPRLHLAKKTFQRFNCSRVSNLSTFTLVWSSVTCLRFLLSF